MLSKVRCRMCAHETDGKCTAKPGSSVRGNKSRRCYYYEFDVSKLKRRKNRPAPPVTRVHMAEVLEQKRLAAWMRKYKAASPELKKRMLDAMRRPQVEETPKQTEIDLSNFKTTGE